MIGSYTIGKKLGEGTYGIVYSATKDGKQYAIKEPKYGLTSDYIREISALSPIPPNTLGISNIVELLDKDSKAYIVYEYHPSDMWKELKSTVRRYSPRKVSYQILRGIFELHSRGRIHRDIKPDNILFDGENAYITDLGISRYLIGRPINMTTRILPVGYSPPEVVLGSQMYDASADIWSLGIVILELHTGIRPLPRDYKEMPNFIADLLGDGQYDSIPTTRHKSLQDYKRLGAISEDVYDLLIRMLVRAPTGRWKAYELLNHMYFADKYSKFTILPNVTNKYNTLILQMMRRFDENLPRPNLIEPNRYQILSEVFNYNIRIDTLHLALYYYDLLGDDIDACIEVAANVMEVHELKNRLPSSRIADIVFGLRGNCYLPYYAGMFKLVTGGLDSESASLLTDAMVMGLNLIYTMYEVVMSIAQRSGPIYERIIKLQ